MKMFGTVEWLTMNLVDLRNFLRLKKEKKSEKRQCSVCYPSSVVVH